MIIERLAFAACTCIRERPWEAVCFDFALGGFQSLQHLCPPGLAREFSENPWAHLLASFSCPIAENIIRFAASRGGQYKGENLMPVLQEAGIFGDFLSKKNSKRTPGDFLSEDRKRVADTAAADRVAMKEAGVLVMGRGGGKPKWMTDN